jgi:uncharacterized protein
VLVARRRERLEALKAEIEGQHGVSVEPLVADLANDEELRRVAERVGKIENLAFLVHAAGFGTRGHFAEKDIESQIDMVQVHNVAALRLTRAALPTMIARGHGAIIHVSSIAAWAASPGGTTYGATKAFLNIFCEGLQGELAGTGVQVQSLCPGFTHSEFHATPEWAGFTGRSIPEILWQSSDQVALESLRALRTGEVIVVTGRLNRLYTKLARLGVVRAVARKVVTVFRGDPR